MDGFENEIFYVTFRHSESFESYLYGQLHFDSMDGSGKDPFTSSREGIVEDDEDYQSLLDYLKRIALPSIFDRWDELSTGTGRRR